MFTRPNFIKFAPKFLFTSAMSAKDKRLLQTVSDKLKRSVFQISSYLGERGVGFCSLQHRWWWKHLFPSGLVSLVLLSCRDSVCAGELSTF